MKFTIAPKTIDWWYWLLTYALIIAALAGWERAYLGVILVSAWQVVHFSMRNGAVAFPTQVRWFYFLITLTGLIPAIRLYMFIALLGGTTMVTFFDRCILAKILAMMPWNRGVTLR